MLLPVVRFVFSSCHSPTFFLFSFVILLCFLFFTLFFLCFLCLFLRKTRTKRFSCCCSAGKSFVAEILMLRRVILTGKMALLVLPYVSICAEKVLFFWPANMLKFKNYISYVLCYCLDSYRQNTLNVS